MISTFTTSVPRCFESLKRIVLPFVVETADGQLANFAIPNNSGSIFADFTKAGATARKTTGPVDVTDGLANKVIDIPGATIEIEQGASDPALWPGVMLGYVSVVGIESGGEVWAGRSLGVHPEDPRSLLFEMAKSSQPSSLGQLVELSGWVKK